MNETAQARNEFIAGSIGGAAGVCTGHPFDTVKVLSQISHTNESLSAIISARLREQGLKGFYRGMSAPLVTDSFVSAVIFTAYYTASTSLFRKDPQKDVLTPSESFISGLVAGVPGALLNCPIELLKIKLQQPGSPFTSPLQLLRFLVSTEGIPGLFRGLTPTLVRDIPAYALYFCTYSAVKRFLHDRGQAPDSDSAFGSLLASPAFCAIVGGGVAGIASWGVAYPFDVIKSRMQAQHASQKLLPLVDAQPYYRNMLHCFRHSVDQSGYRILVRGITPTLIRAFPVNGAIFGVYELSMAFLKKTQ